MSFSFLHSTFLFPQERELVMSGVTYIDTLITKEVLIHKFGIKIRYRKVSIPVLKYGMKERLYPNLFSLPYFSPLKSVIRSLKINFLASLHYFD